MVDYTPLAQPAAPDDANWLNFYRTGYNQRRQNALDAVAEENRTKSRQVYNALANDKIDEAKKGAFDSDTYAAVKKWQAAADDRQTKAAQDQLKLIYGATAEVNDPVSWDRAKVNLRNAGVKLGKYENIPFETAKGMLAGELGQVSQHLEQKAAQQKELQDLQGRMAQSILAAKGDPKRQLAAINYYKGKIDVSPFIRKNEETGEYEPNPGAIEYILGMGGQGKTVFDAEAKKDIAETKAAKGGGLGAAGNMALQKISYFENDPENAGVVIPGDVRQKLMSKAGGDYVLQKSQDGKTAIAVAIDARTKTAYDAAERQMKANQEWLEANPDASEDEKRQHPSDWKTNYEWAKNFATSRLNAETKAKSVGFQTDPNQPGSRAYANTAAGAESITYGREAAKSNAKLDTQNARIDAFHDQAQKFIDYAADPARRADAERAVGWMSTRVGQEYWRTGKGDNVPSIIFNLRAGTHLLQDELAQYVATKGGSSDMRAKNAFEALGDIPSSPNLETAIDRLMFADDMVQSMKKVRRLKGTSPEGASTKEEPLKNPLKAAPNTKPESSAASKMSDEDLKKALGL